LRWGQQSAGFEQRYEEDRLAGLAGGPDRPRRYLAALFDDLVRAGEDRLRDRQTERLRRLQIDHQLESCRFDNGNSAGLAPLSTLLA
jgi:hypothetical protein